MACKVILERQIPQHDGFLYQAAAVDRGVDNWSAVDDSACGRFAREGYLVVRSGLSAGEIEAARNELRAMTLAADPHCASVYYESTITKVIRQRESPFGESAPSDSPSQDKLAIGAVVSELPDVDPRVRAKYVRKFMGFLADHPPLHDIAAKNELIAVVEQIVGHRVRVFQDMAMIKPPGGREKPWHQDHAYFNLPLSTPVLGVWIALDDVTPENGCMYVEPGGHRLGPRPHFMRRDWQICDSEVARERIAAVPMNAGDVLLFDSKLPHGTPWNATDNYRWALQFHYIPVEASEGSDAERLSLFGSEGKGVSC